MISTNPYENKILKLGQLNTYQTMDLLIRPLASYSLVKADHKTIPNRIPLPHKRYFHLQFMPVFTAEAILFTNAFARFSILSVRILLFSVVLRELLVGVFFRWQH